MMPLPNTTCARKGCSEPTPWDMACIVFDARAFCSPDCAQQQLEALDRVPESVTLHDPQFAVDRAGHPYANADDVDIVYQVDGREDARMTIRECESIHPYEFRFSGEAQ